MKSQHKSAKELDTEHQINVEFYHAWLKDTDERDNPDNQKIFREIAENAFKEKEVILRNERVSLNMCASLSAILTKSSITKLDLYRNFIRDTGCESLAHFLHEDCALTYLNLGANGIGTGGIQVLAGVFGNHPRLQFLILSNKPEDPCANQIDASSTRFLLEKLRNNRTLKELDLSGNPIGEGSQEIYAPLRNFIQLSASLQTLRIAATKVTTEGVISILDAVSKSTTLTTIDISDNNLRISVAHTLARLVQERLQKAATSAMKGLILRNNPAFGSEGCKCLFDTLNGDKAMMQLNVQGCGVDDNAVFTLSRSLERNLGLLELDLQNNAITEMGALELARVVYKHPVLSHLALGHNRIKDDGACAMASVVQVNNNITFLDLTETWISDRGLTALGIALANNTSLLVLKLGNNHISDDGAAAFSALIDKNKKLLKCVLKGNNIGYGTVSRVDSIITRNNAIRADEVPNKLRKEMMKLHYQMYKLEEAKVELAYEREKRTKIDQAYDEFERKVQMDEADYKKKQKELLEQTATAEAQTRAANTEYETIIESFRKYESQTELDITHLKSAHEIAIKEREQAEDAYKGMKAQVEAQGQNSLNRQEEVRAKIQVTHDDRGKWEQQMKVYKTLLHEAREKVKGLEMQVSEITGSKKVGKKVAKEPKVDKKRKAEADIANLLQNENVEGAAVSAAANDDEAAE